MNQLKPFMDLEFSDAFLFAATMENEEICRSVLEPGTNFNQLPRSFIIFICTFDPFHHELYRYTYKPICQETQEELSDDTCRIFLSTAGKNDQDVSPELIAFLRYVSDSGFLHEAPEDGLLQKIDSRISYLKRSRRLEERYMLFGEMLDDKKEEGRREERELLLRLIQAMSSDDRASEIPRLTTDSAFLEEMLNHYQIKSD